MTIWGRRAARAVGCVAAAAVGILIVANATAQNHPVNLRGELTAVNGDRLTLAERSGRTMTLVLGEKSRIGTLVRAKLDDVKTGDFIGTAAVPRPDGKLVAQEVLIFPKGFRPGEGHRPWDLTANSTMTNADVSGIVSSSGGEELTLTYEGGKKTLIVPPDTPVVTTGKPDRSLLVVGAHVFALAARQADGSYDVIRISVGKGGLVPPM